MAKFKLAGNALVIQSEVKMEDMLKVQKYRKDKLTVKKEINGQEVILFGVCADKKLNNIFNKTYAVFSEDNVTEDGYGVITLEISNSTEGLPTVEDVIDECGEGLIYLNQIEKQMETALYAIQQNLDLLTSKIEIV